MCTFCHSGPETMVGLSAAGMMFTKARVYIRSKWGAPADDEETTDRDVAAAPAA